MHWNSVRLLRWRVYAGPSETSGLYVLARVFATKDELLTALRAEAEVWGTGDRFSREVEGACQSFRTWVHASGRLKPHFATVSFYRGRLGQEVVTHEFAHAAFAWATRKQLRGHADAAVNMERMEEPVCYALGRMVRRFVARAYALGLYGEQHAH